MTKIQKFTVKGVKSEDISLPKDITGEINLPLLAQAVYVYEDRGHIGLRKTKTRSEVNRTSKKVYKQKGTGGARHGSRRAPIFVGGGVALGPRPVKRVLTLSTDLKNKARIIAYSLKAEEKELVAVSGLGGIKKTKDVAVLTNALRKATGAKRFTFVVSDKAEVVSRCIKNVKIASCVFYKNANAMDIFKGGMIVLDLDVFGAQEKPVEAKAKTIKKTVKEKTAK